MSRPEPIPDASAERAPLPEALERPPHGRVLLLVPHADDDVLGAGGTCALHREQGDPVHVLVGYDGVEGDRDRRHSPEEYRQLRRAEARAGGRHLGLEDYEFWDYPEGHLPPPPVLLETARRLAARLVELEIDTLYCPWVGEYHLDHHVTARMARLAIASIRWPGVAWGYEVWTPLVPTRVVDVSAVHARKVAALAEHGSQLAYHDIQHKGLALSAHRAMYLAPEARQGEAFAPLGAPWGSDRALLPG